MKIIISIDNYYPNANGSSYFAQRLAYYLKQRGHDVLTIVPSLSWGHKPFVHNGVEAFGIASFPLPFYKGFRIVFPVGIKNSIEKRILEFKPDVIHIQDHFTIGSAIHKIAKKHKIPIMGTNHFLPENLIHYLHLPKKLEQVVKKIAWAQFRKIFENLHVVTTPTATAAAHLKEVKLTKPVLAVSNGIDLKRFNPNNNGEYLKKRFNLPNKPTLLYVGRLDKEKNLDLVLQAVNIARLKVDFHFVIAGRGAEGKKLKKLAQELKLSNHVTFAGFVPDEDLQNLYMVADCFVIAGIAELQSIVTMEAMASGLPVVAVNAMALPELVKHKENGHLFEIADVNGLAGSLVEIFLDKALRKSMGQKSLEMIQSHGIDKTMDIFESLYKEAVASKK